MAQHATPEEPDDSALMALAIAHAQHSRLLSPPNPWVGCVVAAPDGTLFVGRTQRHGQRHAERVALDAAAERSAGATLYTTLEPCNHAGKTGPCTEAIVEAKVARVVVGLEDPDPRVAGTGVLKLREAGIEVETGVEAQAVEHQLMPYLHHRRTGRPLVVAKLAATLDGQTAAADGSSQWITGAVARHDAHLLRAHCDAILVGAGTIRADNPKLTVRDIVASDGEPPREPLRVVLGKAESGAAVHPCLELSGDLGGVLDELGSRGVMQLMVEGGAHVVGEFHRSGLIDRYVLYLAPALMGGSDGTPLLAGSGARTISEIFRGEIVDYRLIGSDLRVEIVRDQAHSN